MNVAGFRTIQADQQLHERSFARAGRTHERDCLATRHAERYALQGRLRSGVVLETHVAEFESIEFADGRGVGGARFGLHRQDGFEFLQRDFGLAISIDHIAQFLQGSEDEEGVNEQRHIIANRQTVGEDQIHHEELNAGPQEVDEGALNETQAAQIADLFELQFQDLCRCGVEPADFLLRQPKALYQLDVAQRFRS